MKQALFVWVDQEEEHRRMTVEAMSDIEAGQLIEHQSVQAWAESLGSDKTVVGAVLMELK